MKNLQKDTTTIAYAFLAFYLLLAIRNAWISDDAMITFRVVENFLAGYGLGYNPYVRVQAFTHPLWMFLISLFYFVERLFIPSLPSALFFITIFLSIALSGLTVFLLLTRIAKPNVLSLALGIVPLALSNGFIDFSTSGLENPLTHFLLVLFVLFYLRDAQSLFHLSLISAFILLNRIDAFLLVLPALGFSWWSSPHRKGDAVKILLGFLPIIVWEIFSLIYFGFLFPNTAYAKLNTGVSDFALILQGFDYFLNSINWDTITLFCIGLAGFSLYAERHPKFTFLFIGVLLYLAYIVKIGGDFMAGRFFSAPLLLSVVIISNQVTLRKQQVTSLVVMVLLGVFSIRSPLWSSNMVVYMPTFQISDRSGVSDQRLHYFGNERKEQFNSFVENGFRKTDWGSAFAGKEWQFSAFNTIYIADALGKPGYSKGPNVYVIDNYALSDPLLARLPALDDWEIGHFRRLIPEGYVETLESGENQIIDANLSLYYSKLNIIVNQPIWDWNRMVEIWKFNTGQYDALLESYISDSSN